MGLSLPLWSSPLTATGRLFTLSTTGSTIARGWSKSGCSCRGWTALRWICCRPSPPVGLSTDGAILESSGQSTPCTRYDVFSNVFSRNNFGRIYTLKPVSVETAGSKGPSIRFPLLLPNTSLFCAAYIHVTPFLHRLAILFRLFECVYRYECVCPSVCPFLLFRRINMIICTLYYSPNNRIYC